MAFTNCKTILKEYSRTLNVQFDNIRPLVIAEIKAVVASCNEANGSLAILGDGGVGQLQYSINEEEYQEESIFESLAAGTYTISLKDERACRILQEIVLDQFLPPNLLKLVLVPPYVEKHLEVFWSK